jgi:hypothetical protein
MSGSQLAKFKILPTPLAPPRFQEILDEVVAELRESPEKLAKIEVDPADLATGKPFVAGRDEGQADVATAILISVASSLAAKAAEAIWTTYIWPKLQAEFGAKIEGAPEDPT